MKQKWESRYCSFGLIHRVISTTQLKAEYVIISCAYLSHPHQNNSSSVSGRTKRSE